MIIYPRVSDPDPVNLKPALQRNYIQLPFIQAMQKLHKIAMIVYV